MIGLAGRHIAAIAAALSGRRDALRARCAARTVEAGSSVAVVARCAAGGSRCLPTSVGGDVASERGRRARVLHHCRVQKVGTCVPRVPYGAVRNRRLSRVLRVARQRYIREAAISPPVAKRAGSAAWRGHQGGPASELPKVPASMPFARRPWGNGASPQSRPTRTRARFRRMLQAPPRPSAR